MEEKLPEELPGHAAAIPHPEHVERVESWTDRLLQALSGHREQPATARHWLKPTEELPAHVLQVVFAPTPGAASVELLVGGEDERPVIRVDCNFCAWHRAPPSMTIRHTRQIVKSLSRRCLALAHIIHDRRYATGHVRRS